MELFTNIELFAGCGGLALGLEKAGFKTIGLLDNDKDSCDTLRANRPNWNIIETDITSFSEKILLTYFNLSIGELDLLSGGYPCQSFSYAGKKLGLDDTRGTMFYHYAKFLKQLQPKMFLVENVKGLKNHDNGKTFQTMLNIFNELGYKTVYKVLNAWDYGVAQKRERLFLVGIRKGLNISFEFPLPLDYKLVLKDVLKDVPYSEGLKYSENRKKVFELVPQGGWWKDLPHDVIKEYCKFCLTSGGSTGVARRLSFDEPCLTLLTSPIGKLTDRCHPNENRPLTTREYARIQSFPDEWKFSGKLNSLYKQIGNAVPVELAKHVGVSLINSLKEN